MATFFALGSSLAFCFVSVCDKRLLSFHFQGVAPLCLWCGSVGLLYGSVMLAVVGVPAGTAWPTAVLPAGAGLLMGCSVVLLFRGLRLMEASRAVAIAQTNPIFVALLAMLLLGERIAPAQWGAIGLVVAGAVLISVRMYQEAPYGRIGAGLSVPSPAVGLGDRTAWYGPGLLVASALCAASSFVAAKGALNAGLPTLTVFAMQQTVVGAVFFAVGVAGGGRRRLLAAVRQPPALGDADFRRVADAGSVHPAVGVRLQPGRCLAGGGGAGDAPAVRVHRVNHPLPACGGNCWTSR